MKGKCPESVPTVRKKQPAERWGDWAVELTAPNTNGCLQLSPLSGFVCLTHLILMATLRVDITMTFIYG